MGGSICECKDCFIGLICGCKEDRDPYGDGESVSYELWPRRF